MRREYVALPRARGNVPAVPHYVIAELDATMRARLQNFVSDRAAPLRQHFDGRNKVR